MTAQVKVYGAPHQFAPDVFAVQITNWIEAGIAPDSRLLQAILANDLGRAVALCGDALAWALVHDTLFWLWRFAPVDSYGSKAAVTRWEQRAAMSGRILDGLREQLARAEQNFICAEMIDDTRRQQSERAYWAGEVERLRAAIERREEV